MSGALLVSAPLALGRTGLPGGSVETARASSHELLRDAPPPAHTGGFGEPTCLICHSGNDPNDTRGSLKIDAPASYTSGATYRIRVRLRHPELRAGGFEASIRDRSGLQAGQIVIDTSQTGVTSFGEVLYVHHRRATTKAAGDSIEWTFAWTAPDGTDDVTIHVAANAADDDDSPLGDFIFTHSIVIPARRPGP